MKKTIFLVIALATIGTNAFSKEVVLGKRVICDAKVEREIFVKGKGKFRAIQLEVSGPGRLEIDEVEITFGNGGEQEAERFRPVVKNSSTRYIDFNGGYRKVRKIEIEGDTAGESGCSRVVVKGVR